MAQEGACLFSKRLEKGRFIWPSAKDGKIALTPAQLAMLLEGEEDQKTIWGIVFPTQDWRLPLRTSRPLTAG